MVPDENTVTESGAAAVATETDGPLVPTAAPKEEPRVALPAMPFYGRWRTDEITIKDPGLRKYINLDMAGVPHTGGRRHANRLFGKAKVSVVERLINGMMRTEIYTGNKQSSYKLVGKAFAEIELKTKEKPIQVLVRALGNAAPKEEITRLRFGGINVPKAVDTSPQRRLDIGLRHIAQGAMATSFKNVKPIHQCLADEIIKAAKDDVTSFAVGKKEEMERVAKSAR
jgi:small subunit ribosomal protein S7